MYTIAHYYNYLEEAEVLLGISSFFAEEDWFAFYNNRFLVNILRFSFNLSLVSVCVDKLCDLNDTSLTVLWLLIEGY